MSIDSPNRANGIRITARTNRQKANRRAPALLERTSLLPTAEMVAIRTSAVATGGVAVIFPRKTDSYHETGRPVKQGAPPLRGGLSGKREHDGRGDEEQDEQDRRMDGDLAGDRASHGRDSLEMSAVKSDQAGRRRSSATLSGEPKSRRGTIFARGGRSATSDRPPRRAARAREIKAPLLFVVLRFVSTRSSGPGGRRRARVRARAGRPRSGPPPGARP